MNKKEYLRMPLTSADVNGERMERLRELFPEAVSEGKIDLERLGEVLGEAVDDGRERYGLSWAGKGDAIRAIQVPSVGTLIPCPDESVDFDTTENLFIEGDNLEVLKLLQKSYHGKVKMIYIDPPYNTGNEFIYPDDFREGLQTYLRYTGQINDAGINLSTNKETSGRFHSKWLSMMFPRLFLGRNLLAQDGIICISIGEGELANLKKLMDEIFGEDNYINTVSIKSKVAAGASGGGEDKRLKKNIEYILIYAKNLNQLRPLVHSFKEEPLTTTIRRMNESGESWKYTNVLLSVGKRKFVTTIKDAKGQSIDVYAIDKIKRTTIKEICIREKIPEEEAYKKYFSKIFSDTNAQSSIRSKVIEACPPLESGQIYEMEYIPRSGRYKGKKVTRLYISRTIRLIIWLSDVAYIKEGIIRKKERLGTLWDWFNYNNVGKEGGIPFPNGKKPIDLIKTCLWLNEDKNGIILDYFAGSCSSAHAVLTQNEEDNGRRKFICIQLPEQIKDMEFKNISDLGKERIRRVIKKLKEEDEGQLDFKDREKPEDLGFKVFKLSSSNFKIWDAGEAPKDDKGLAEQLNLYADHVLPDRSDQDILFELLLKAGRSLTAQIEEKKVGGKTVYSIEDGTLLICLEERVTAKALRGMVGLKPRQVICLDNAFGGNDQLKTNTVLEMRDHEIEFMTV